MLNDIQAMLMFFLLVLYVVPAFQDLTQLKVNLKILYASALVGIVINLVLGNFYTIAGFLIGWVILIPIHHRLPLFGGGDAVGIVTSLLFVPNVFFMVLSLLVGSFFALIYSLVIIYLQKDIMFKIPFLFTFYLGILITWFLF